MSQNSMEQQPAPKSEELKKEVSEVSLQNYLSYLSS